MDKKQYYYHVYSAINNSSAFYHWDYSCDDYTALIKYLKSEVGNKYMIYICEGSIPKNTRKFYFKGNKGEYPNIFNNTDFPIIEKGVIKNELH